MVKKSIKRKVNKNAELYGFSFYMMAPTCFGKTVPSSGSD
jgi:hypothetical protein